MPKSLSKKSAAKVLPRLEPSQPVKAYRIHRWPGDDTLRPVSDDLAVEEPLEIQVDTQSVSVTLRTPGHDDELAVGFLLSEGIVQHRDDIREVRPYPRNQAGNVVNVFLANTVRFDPKKLTRHVFVSSSCGLCGKASIQQVHQHFPSLSQMKDPLPKISLRALALASQQMSDSQSAFAQTGGIHAAALATRSAEMTLLREDVGRHNAVDKVLGRSLLDGLLPLSDHILLVSGRASFEIMQKALAGRIAIVAAIGAPSSLAVDFARESGQTLIGFLRGQRANVYSGRERLQLRE